MFNESSTISTINYIKIVHYFMFFDTHCVSLFDSWISFVINISYLFFTMYNRLDPSYIGAYRVDQKMCTTQQPIRRQHKKHLRAIYEPTIIVLLLLLVHWSTVNNM